MQFSNYLLRLDGCEIGKVRESICLHNCSFILKEIYRDIKKSGNRNNIKLVCNRLGVPYQTFYCWVSGRNPIPISKVRMLINMWEDVCGKSNVDSAELWEKVFFCNNEFSQNASKKVKLPKELNKNLGYLVGYFQGDGHLKKANEKSFQEYSIYFYDADLAMLEKVNELMFEEFGIWGNIYFQSNSTGSWHTLRFSSKPIYLFFKNVLGLRAGKKVGTIETPAIISSAGAPVQLSFIGGFFDAEGGIGKTSKNSWLDIGQASTESSPEILFWISKVLNQNGIEVSKPQKTSGQNFFRIRTSKRDTIKKFFKVVPLYHSKKINKFNEVIKQC